MRIATRFLIVLGLLALIQIGCQTGTHNSLSGNWAASTSSTSNNGPGSTAPLAFTFTMTEGKAGSGGNNMASLSLTNPKMMTTNGIAANPCFDSNATASGRVSNPSTSSARTATITLSEAGNTAMFDLNVGSDNDSMSGSFALTGGNALPGSSAACPASDSGTATFKRQ